MAAITQLDSDTAASCQAVADRLDKYGDQAHTDAGAVQASVDAVEAALTSTSTPIQVQLPAGGSGQAVQVTNWPGDQQVKFDGAATTQLDGNAQSEHGDLWVLIGAVVSIFLFDVFLRKVWP